jgi:dextranase
MKKLISPWMLFAFLTACGASDASAPATNTPPPAATETAALLPTATPTETPGVLLQSLEFPTAFFLPGETARWDVTLTAGAPQEVVLISKITYLDQILAEERQELSLPAATPVTAEIVWESPAEAPRGYGLDISVETPDGERLASISAGFDVLAVWTQNPRYGFLTNFTANRQEPVVTLGILNRYHINGLQFYDWMYRHDTYLPPQDTFRDPLGRELSFDATKQLIATAHDYRMAAMPYTAIYAASSSFYRDHPDWGVYLADGSPATFGGTFLYIMDPRPDSPWGAHLLDQFAQILAETDFDGIHLDQFGWPKDAYDAEGNFFALDQALADMIDSTSELVKETRGETGTVIFNAVTNWPIQTVAPSKEDIVYIEVWDPYTDFNDLYELINQAQGLGGGKAVVLAAYLDPAYEVNVLLMDAVIFASGGGHLELGENARILTDPYFPNYKVPSDELLENLQRYYDFAVRYQNVIGPAASPVNIFANQMVAIDGVNTVPHTPTDKVMPIVRENDRYTAVSLINLLGLEHGHWRDKVSAPEVLLDVDVTIPAAGREAAQVWVASPDQADLSLQAISFQQTDDEIALTLPSLAYWTMILIEWSE